jgi:hypothetical protein
MLLEENAAMAFRTPRTWRRAAIPLPPQRTELPIAQECQCNGRDERCDHDRRDDTVVIDAPFMPPSAPPASPSCQPSSWPRIFPGL